MLGCRNGVDKVALRLAADFTLPRPAFSASTRAGLCVQPLRRPGSRKAYLFAKSMPRGLP